MRWRKHSTRCGRMWKRKLVVVFGAGGDRDQGKRPLMGAIAVQKADRVVITDDNPRTEEAAAIRKAILAAAPGAVEIGDRRKAIRQAVADLQSGDVLLIAARATRQDRSSALRCCRSPDHEAVADALREPAA